MFDYISVESILQIYTPIKNIDLHNLTSTHYQIPTLESIMGGLS